MMIGGPLSRGRGLVLHTDDLCRPSRHRDCLIYRSDGIILTNHHVVADASRIDVGFADGSRIPGQVTATDPDTDLAVIRVDRSGLPAAKFQKSLPQVGNLAVVLGSLRQHDPGEVVSISYLRDGETQTAQAQITDRPS